MIRSPGQTAHWHIPCLFLAGVSTLLASCGGGPEEFRPVMVSVPAHEGSGEPHLAVTRDGKAVLSWVEPEGSGHALRFATLDKDNWSPRVTVARGEGWFVNWADFPSVVPVSDSLWAAHWLSRQPAGGYAYDVMMSLSTDAGGTWGEPFSPHTDGTQTEHGFVTLFPWRGEAGAVWLDGRNMTGGEAVAEGDHAHGEGGMTLRAAALAPGGLRSHESVLDSLTCDCCQTDVADGGEGPIVVYRDRSEDEIRDIYLVRAVERGWTDPVVVAVDGWRIEGCPVNGPAVAAAGADVVVAWFTAAEAQPRVRLARSLDGGRTFGDPVDVDTEAPLGRVDVALLSGGDAAVSWLRPVGEAGAMFALRRVHTDGSLGEVRSVAVTGAGRPSGFPQMVLAQERLVLSWTEADEAGTRVRSAWVDPDQL